MPADLDAVHAIVRALQTVAPHLEGQPEAEEALREARNACTRLAARLSSAALPADLDAIRERYALGQATDADVGALLARVERLTPTPLVEPTANPRAACAAPGRAGAHDWHTTRSTAVCRACGATTALLLRPDSLT